MRAASRASRHRRAGGVAPWRLSGHWPWSVEHPAWPSSTCSSPPTFRPRRGAELRHPWPITLDLADVLQRDASRAADPGHRLGGRRDRGAVPPRRRCGRASSAGRASPAAATRAPPGRRRADGHRRRHRHGLQPSARAQSAFPTPSSSRAGDRRHRRGGGEPRARLGSCSKDLWRVARHA